MSVLQHLNHYETIDKVARLCHEANRVWCELNGDFTNVPWSATPEVIKNSTQHAVARIFHENCVPDPQELHARWCEYKKNEGWKCGTPKDVVNLIHPELVEWQYLPFASRMKSHIFCNLLTAFLEG